jgi:thymidylate kinase
MLEINKIFFEHLNTLNVRYCHWKSNEHLDRALAGKTDLDVLVHQSDKIVFEKALQKFQFKKVLSPPDKQFPHLEDYLGFDYTSGAFTHLHVHYQLILGQKYIKNHHLPIEDLVFNNLITKDNVFIPCPELELILLVIRAHMKVDLLSLAKHAVKDLTPQRYTALPSDIENELNTLATNRDSNKLNLLLSQSKLPIPEDFIDKFINRLLDGKLRFYHLYIGHLKILHALKEFRRNKSSIIYIKYLKHFSAELPLIRSLRITKRKTLPGSGRIISIVGADGSGKSTLVNDIAEWLSWKLFVKRYYYGIPKNIISNAAYFFIRNFNRVRLTIFADIVEGLYWLYVARVRRSISISSKKDSRDGKVIITDRYPLNHFRTMPEPMDGPRLRNNTTFIGRFFSEREAKMYDEIETPDRIIVLQADIDELRKRKADLSLDTHKLKAAFVNSLQESDTIVLVDANKPYEEVLLQAKRLIWDIL